MFRLFSKKTTMFSLFLALSFFAGSKQLHSMNRYHLPSQQQIVDEVKSLFDSTPTGFTFFIKTLASNCASDLGLLVSCSWKLIRHPINSANDICLNTYETATQALSFVGRTLSFVDRGVVNRGVVNSYKAVLHPIEASKAAKKAMQNAASLVLTITLHPINNASKVLKFFDSITKDDLPIVGNVVGNVGQLVGFVKITPDNCPLLHGMLARTAHRLECQNISDGFYIFKGSSLTNILESLGMMYDLSCNAITIGFTHGTSFIFVGKDLFLGVNPNQASHVSGLSPEQIQAACAHEMGHYKFRHMLQRLIFDSAIAGILTWLLIDVLLDSAKNGGPAVNWLYEMANEYIVGTIICTSVGCFKISRKLIDLLLTQGFYRLQERQADINALRALDNPAAMSDGLIKLVNLVALKRKPLSELLKDHPDIGTRVNYLQEEAARVLRERGLPQ